MERVEVVKLDMTGFVSSGRYKHATLLLEMLRASGKHKQRLVFQSPKERRQYIEGILTPYVERLNSTAKSQITHWLRSNGVTPAEISLIYAHLGIPWQRTTRLMAEMIRYVEEESEKHDASALPEDPDDYTLYTLWRYQGIPIETLAKHYGVSVESLRDLFGEIFYQKCLSAKDKCIFRRFLDQIEERPRCKLEGCDNLTNWEGRQTGWRPFCSHAHAIEYARRHPETLLNRQKIISHQRVEAMLKAIEDGEIRYQTELKRFLHSVPKTNRGNYESKYAFRLLKTGRIKRKRVLRNGRWTYRLIPVNSSK